MIKVIDQKTACIRVEELVKLANPSHQCLRDDLIKIRRL